MDVDQNHERQLLRLDAQSKLDADNNEQLTEYNKIIEESAVVESAIEGLCDSQPVDSDYWKALDSCLKDPLMSFVYVRKYESLGKKDPIDPDFKLCTNRGKSGPAQSGELNALKQAFDCRVAPVVLKKPTPKQLPKPSNNRCSDMVRITSQVSGFTDPSYVKASSCLSDSAWIELVKTTFCDQQHNMQDIGNGVFCQVHYDRADKMQMLLTGIFVNHVSN